MNTPKLVVCLILSLFAAAPFVRAQRYQAPNGETTITAFEEDYYDEGAGTYALYRYTVTPNGIYGSDYNPSTFSWTSTWTQFKAPPGRTIKDAARKGGRMGVPTLLVLLDNGDVYQVAYPSVVKRMGTLAGGPSESFKKIIGDDVYVLGSSNLYVTHDNGQTWQVDSAGLNGAHINDIAMDQDQNLYAATSQGFKFQRVNQTSWNSTANDQALTSVYVEMLHKQVIRIIVVGTDEIAQQTPDTGKQWSPSDYPKNVIRYGQDLYDDMFFVTSDGAIHEFVEPVAWRRIDTALNTAAGMPIDGTSSLRVNSIGGDSIVVAATNYGIFSSSDRGATWQQSNEGIHAERFYGLVKDATGFFMASTSQGIFSTGQLGTKWNKIYPTQGYMGGLPLVTGGYSTYAILPTYPRVLRTSDGGSSWVPDTLGESSIDFNGIMTVDENGTLHAVSSHYGSSWKGYIYEKKLGEAWHADTLGYSPKNYSYGGAIAADGKGNIFVSGVFPGGASVMRRAVSGNTWSVDTSGLGSSNLYFNRFASGQSLYGATNNAIYLHTGTGWQRVLPPSSVASSSVSAFSSATNGTLYAAFSSYSGAQQGVYYTNDNGVNWTFAGFDGLGIQSLYSDGQTTYAATNNGIYQVAAAAATASTVVSPTTLDFGNVAVGDSSSEIVTIANTGTEALNITSITSPDPSFTSQGFINLVAPMDSLKFPVQFKPTHGGPVTSTLSIAIANDPSSPYTVMLKGNGVASGVAETDASPLALTNYPNPFSQATTLSFTLPEREHASLIVRDILGNEMARVADAMFDAGTQSAQWNAGALPEGVYVVEMRAGETVARRFVTVMR